MSGTAYQVQVEIPVAHRFYRGCADAARRQQREQDRAAVGDVAGAATARCPARSTATTSSGWSPSSATFRSDPGRAAASQKRSSERAIIARRTVARRGQVPAMQETLTGLGTGLVLAIVAIPLLLAGYFHRRGCWIALSANPAVLTEWRSRGLTRDAQRAVLYGRDYGRRRVVGERDSAGEFCRAGAQRRRDGARRRVSGAFESLRPI